MNPTLPRGGRLSWWLSGLYLAWSCLVYFGTLGRNGHEWWPIFLAPLILPWSLVHMLLFPQILAWLVPNPQTAPEWVWILNDYIAGAFYIVVGTAWFWYLGKLIPKILRRLKGQKTTPNQSPQPTPPTGG